MASLYLDKRSGLYYAQFFDKQRRPRRKKIALKTKRKRTAERALARLEDEYALGQLDPWAPPEEPEEPEEEREDLSRLGDATDAYLASCSHLKPSTQQSYRDVVRPFERHLGRSLSVKKIRPKHVLAWLDSTDANPVTRKKYNDHLGYLFRFLVRRGFMERDISKEVKLRKVPEQAPKAMRPEEVDKLIETILNYSEKHRRNARIPDHTWLAHLVSANVHLGLRRGELIHLRWEHVHLDRRLLRVVNSDEFTTKSSKERAIPISEQALVALQHLRDHRLSRCPYVFHVKGQRIKPSTLSHAFRRFRKRAKLPAHINLHSTRHTFGTRLAERGVPVTVIQNLMGHSTVTTTERYMSVRADVAEQWITKAFGGNEA